MHVINHIKRVARSCTLHTLLLRQTNIHAPNAVFTLELCVDTIGKHACLYSKNNMSPLQIGKHAYVVLRHRIIHSLISDIV